VARRHLNTTHIVRSRIHIGASSLLAMVIENAHPNKLDGLYPGTRHLVDLIQASQQ